MKMIQNEGKAFKEWGEYKIVLLRIKRGKSKKIESDHGRTELKLQNRVIMWGVAWFKLQLKILLKVTICFKREKGNRSIVENQKIDEERLDRHVMKVNSPISETARNY